MAQIRLCEGCSMEFDWPGVTVQNYEYCCEACSRGEECTCEQHHHDYRSEKPLQAAGVARDDPDDREWPG